MSLSEKLKASIARRVITPNVLSLIEREIIRKTRGEIGRYLLMPGPLLREPEWNFELLKEICDQSFVMEMITRTLTQEVARPGLEIKARFVSKCSDCGSEFQSKIEKCSQCNGNNLREPAPNERKRLDEILEKPNPEYDWSRMLRTMVEGDLKMGNWWLSLTYEDTIDADTREITRKIREVYIEDPRWMRILADEKGRIRSNEYFCPRCYIKDEHFTPSLEQIASGIAATCPNCGKPLVMTGYVQQYSGQITARWGVDEIIHGSSTQSLPELYGRPRPLSVWKWLLTLNAMLSYTTEIYSTGYVGGFLVFQGLEQDQVNSMKAQIETELEAKQVIDAATGEAKPSLRIRQAWIGTGALANEKPLEAEFIAGMPDPKKMESLEWFKFGIEKVTSVFGVTPVFVSIIESGRAGNNPRMQIDVQNRSIQEIQNSIISALNHQLIPRLGIEDWELDFKSIELRDELREAQIETTKADAAQRWLNAGFSVRMDPSAREIIVSGEGRLGPEGRKPSEEFRTPGPEISEASGAVLEKAFGPRTRRPAMAIYLVEPHGRMIWTRKKTMVVKSRRFEAHEDEPLLLVENGYAYGVIELTKPREITWKEFGKLYPQHQIERKEATHWGWDKYETLWAYDVKIIDSFTDPIPVVVPRGVRTFVGVENLRFPETLSKQEGHWITTEDGRHVFIEPSGEIAPHGPKLDMTVATPRQIEAKREALRNRLKEEQSKFSYPHRSGRINVRLTGGAGNERLILYTEDEDTGERNTFAEVDLRNERTNYTAGYNTRYFTRRIISEVLRFPETKMAELRKAGPSILGAPQHVHSKVGRGGVKIERGIARKLRSIIMRYHKKEITKEKALEEAKASLLKHRKTLEAIGLRQFMRMTERKIRTLPPEVIKRLDEETEKKLREFADALDDVKKL